MHAHPKPILPFQMTSSTNLVPIHVRVPKTLVTAAKLAAEEDDRTFSYIVRKALETYLKDSGHLGFHN